MLDPAFDVLGTTIVWKWVQGLFKDSDNIDTF